MRVELINTGSELILGRVINSHLHWMGRRLSELGYVLSRQTAVPDDAEIIESAVREALSRADLVIITGGLGPTSDDNTREAIARLLGVELREDPETLRRIRDRFAQRNRPFPEQCRVQALIPAGALVLPNPHGTAPALAIPLRPNPFRHGAQPETSWLILLPGPPRELQPLFDEQVVPLLQRSLPLPVPFICRNLRTTGLGESIIQERIQPPLAGLVSAGLDVGYCARPGQVDVRLAARGSHAGASVDQAEQIVRALLGTDIFSSRDEELEEVVVGLLSERRETVAVAESCTGGCLAHRLTNVPGASAVFRSGWITYSDEAKQNLLGVPSGTIERFGAVSEAVAREMAAGARQAARSDYALAITGIAGPSGGTPAKPVGTVFIALASSQGVDVRHWLNAWDRATFKQVTASQALNQLRSLLTSSKPEK